MPRHPVEVEHTYHVDLDARLPELTRLPQVAAAAPPVEHRLDATYFDTTDLVLARAGITLRRRTGGDDQGWHAELPTIRGRHEIRTAPGRSATTVPKRLRSTLTAFTRDSRLVPVATVRTHRMLHRLLDDHGNVLAEVADDRVTATDTATGTARAWHEWAVEPGHGDTEVLGAAARSLLSHGATTASGSTSALARVLDLPPAATPGADGGALRTKDPARTLGQLRLAEQVARVRRLDPLVRCDAPEAVHDMRVAVRRLHAALATYRPFLDTAVTEPVREELRWLARALSPPRDTEVVRHRLRRALAVEPRETVRGAVRSRTDRELGRQHRQAHAEAVRDMESERYFTLLDHLGDLAAAAPWNPRGDRRIDRVLPARVLHDWKRLQRRMRAAERAEAPAERARLLHESRKAAKRVRYAAEPLVPVYGKQAARFVTATKRVQSALGAHHDSILTTAALRRLADHAAADGTDTFTFGVLHVREERASEAADAELTKAWRHAARKKLRAWLA